MPLILLAEDDVSLSGLVKEALEAQGYKVEQAFDGQQAVQKAQELHPDLLILDVQMPEIYGVGVYTTLQR
ncbi:MAG TPA: response regulator, partial [Elusimicrobiales bacterium]|nr:response regulator [Elusimicrobiales bacterium]